MKLYFNEYSALLACSFVNGLVFTILFWIRAWQEERKSDLLFGFILFFSCLYITDWMLGFMGIHILFQEYFFLPYDAGLAISPLLFFYLKSQLDTSFQFSRKDFWHFLPYIVYLIYHFLVFFQGQDFTKHWVDAVHYPYYIDEIERNAIFISNFTYLFFAFKLYRYYQKWLPTQYTNTESINFSWYHHFLVAYTFAFTVIWVVIFLERFGVRFSYVDIWWVKFLAGITIYYVSIKGYVQKQPKALIFKIETAIEENIESKLLASVISETTIPDLEIWKNKLHCVMETEKLYTNPDLSLSNLAAYLGTSNTFLSILINKGLDKNYNDFINEYRVREFQKKIYLPENEHFSFLGIAYDCGFNSKATFNRAFKKMTGLSPKAWKEKQEALQ